MFFTIFIFALTSLSLLAGVHANLYVINPVSDTVCQGGQSCTVQWVDDGEAPFLSTIGPCHVGLYHGNNAIIQQIDPVDVSINHSLTFTPDPAAGPSGIYYIRFTSVDPVNGTQYNEYSPNFKLENMNGSFDTPVPSDTSSIPVPSSVANAPPNTVSATITVSGKTPTSTPTTTTSSRISTTSSFTTSLISTSATSSSSSTPSSPSTAQNAVNSATRPAFSSFMIFSVATLPIILLSQFG
ncbi:hypothetical protein ABKN59_003871 [Abortiporus biennis]